MNMLRVSQRQGALDKARRSWDTRLPSQRTADSDNCFWVTRP